MVITYHGNGCFRVQSGAVSVVVDPENDRMKPDLALRTLVPTATLSKEKRENEIVGGGEYEMGTVRVKGVSLAGESSETFLKTAYVITLEDIHVAFLGHLSALPRPEFAEQLGNVDIVVVPVGGKPYLDAEEAAKVVKQLGAKIVIPSFFKKDVQAFAKELGQEPETVEKLTLKAKDLAREGVTLVVFKET